MPWVVAGLGFLYYLTPIAAAVVADRSLPADIITRLVLGGVVGLVLLRWRHAHPLGVAVALVPLWALTPSVIGAALVAQENLARRHASRATTVAVGVGLGLAKLVELTSNGVDPTSSAYQVELVLAGAGLVTATLIGLLRRSRAESAEHARRAEAARLDAEAARVNEARLAERERIAREMHDVVAHRISLVAMHAGALAYRTDVDPERAREAARLIQVNAQASLDELRAMLASLRGVDAPPEGPQPTLAELNVLVADAEDAGQDVTLTRSGDLAAVPTRVSRQAFRIVQECLTNARKHAPGAPVGVELVAGEGVLTLRATNGLADLAPDRTGAGLGLVGIAERVGLVGGTVSHGVREGEFVVEAALPLGGPMREDA